MFSPDSPTVIRQQGDPVVSVQLIAGAVVNVGGAAANFRTATAGATIGGNRAIALAGGLAYHASNLVPAHAYALAGISTGASVATSATTIQTGEVMTESSWAWTPNQPIFLGANGLLTQTVPTAPAAFVLIVGVALTPTTMEINPQPPIFI